MRTPIVIYDSLNSEPTTRRSKINKRRHTKNCTMAKNLKRKRSNTQMRGSYRRGAFKQRKTSGKYSGVTTNAYRRTPNYRTSGFLGMEKKFRDQFFTSSAIGHTILGARENPDGGNDCLTGLPVGSGEQERDGRKATIKSVHLKGKLTMISVGSSNPLANSFKSYQVVMCAVLDTQTNGAAVNPTDVFQTVTPENTTMLNQNPYRNLANTGRFRILWKRVFTISPTLVVTDDDAGVPQFVSLEKSYPFDINIPMNLDVTFKGDTAAISSVADNSVQFLCWSAHFDAAAGIPAETRLEYVARTRFEG